MSVSISADREGDGVRLFIEQTETNFEHGPYQEPTTTTETMSPWLSHEQAKRLADDLVQALTRK